MPIDDQLLDFYKEVDRRERLLQEMIQRMEGKFSGRLEEIEQITSKMEINIDRLHTIGRTLLFIAVSLGGLVSFLGAVVAIMGAFKGV